MNEPSLFDNQEADHLKAAMPLAARMRPRSLDEMVGQSHLLAEKGLLRRMVAAGRLGSILLHGPPGTGKTTLATLLASAVGADWIQLNAISSGVKDVREALASARDRVATGQRPPVLFIDEIHRFNKSQQDALLADVESGVIHLIGATTSNPHFAVNAALISRSRLFDLRPIDAKDMQAVLRTAIENTERGLGKRDRQGRRIEITDDAIEHLATACDGDARRALTALELAVDSGGSSDRTDTQAVVVDIEAARTAIVPGVAGYDGTGDDHYDLASALIKSIRGSDVDAAIYWLARMLEGGEDIRFLCRRLVILASEDVGNADPQALPLAVSAMQACEMIGLPEAQLTLAQTVAYLALAPKSNAATIAIGTARREIKSGTVLPVPMALRCTHYAASKSLGHGEGYVYAHDEPGGIAAMDYLGVDRSYYQPVDRGFEAVLQDRLKQIRSQIRAGTTAPET
ncbi:MAG: replication-associated recombination protein A [Planctomycetota bacterium]